MLEVSGERRERERERGKDKGRRDTDREIGKPRDMQAYAGMQTYRDRQTDRPTRRQADMPTYRQHTSRQANRQAVRPADM